MNPQVPSPLGQQPYWPPHPQSGEQPSGLPPPPHPSAPNGAYHPPPPQATSSTLPSLTDPRASIMAAAQYHQHQPVPPPPPHAHYQRPPYQQPPLPGPNQLYPMAHPADPYRGAYATAPQTAPRQRTAIACKYCRRRKIRCSGFDTSEDGKCTNCTRFNQECVFMPVSNTSTQAFVPVHAAFGRGPPPPYQQLYGPLGNPLPSGQDSFGRPAPPPPGAYAMQSPTTPYPQQAPSYPAPPQGYEDRSNASTSTMPYHTPPAPQQPYYAAPATGPGAHPSPPTAYPSHDPSRASASPHSQASPSAMGPSTPSSATYPYHGGAATDPSLRPYSMRTADGRTPPPQQMAQHGPPSQSGTNGQRAGISISSIVSDGASPGTRSTTDSDMLNRLSRP